MNRVAVESRLRELRAELTERLEKIRADLAGGRSRDWEDQAQERENDDVLDALGRDAAEELQAVERALQRLSNDRYGYCLSCQEPIEDERLKALPTAEYCLQCAAG